MGWGECLNKMRRERLFMVTTLIMENEGAVVVHTYPYHRILSRLKR